MAASDDKQRQDEEEGKYNTYRPILDGGEADDASMDQEDDDDESEVSVPMKSPALSESSSYSERPNGSESEEEDDDDDESSLERDSSRKVDYDDETTRTASDGGEDIIYRPVRGEDIYGKSVGNASHSNQPPKKYTPPHLRKSKGDVSVSADPTTTTTTTTTNTTESTSLREMQRSLHHSLNRLSEDTLLSVTQALVRTYDAYATAHVNESLFHHLQTACVARGQTMDGLIPIYVAAIAGVHYYGGCSQRRDMVQLREYVMEHTVTRLMGVLKNTGARTNQPESDLEKEETDEEEDDDVMTREASNLALILCYLYNFGLVHCTLLYDVVRHCLGRFHEVDVEVLLLLLRHSGRALRTDDPLALKEIVLLVQQKQKEQFLSSSSSNTNNETTGNVASSSRADYMVQTIIDLRNNKRRKQDETILERTARIRKLLGHIKSSQDKRATEPLRISLDDILSIETKGRWWKVGASWAGNATMTSPPSDNATTDTPSATTNSSMDAKLLKLAAKYRMNTDTRRAIFCIIMGSEDYEDCFEKLVRAGMLKPRVERDTVRVLTECCRNETSYNKFYSHMAARLCEYQPQCKFSLQLAFWDSFKQMNDDAMEARKAANLAKLLFHLVAVHTHCLKLSVVKPIPMATPEDLSETTLIFLTLFLTAILDYCDDPIQIKGLIETATTTSGSRQRNRLDHDNDGDAIDDAVALRASLTVFLVQVMKASPKYKKGSKFRLNLKAAIKACDLDRDDEE